MENQHVLLYNFLQLHVGLFTHFPLNPTILYFVINPHNFTALGVNRA